MKHTTIATLALSPMVIAVAATAIAMPAGTASASPHVAATVRTFNDGFTDAKRDDCEQGFAPACAWLHRKPGVPAWFHAIAAPAYVARSACGRLPAAEVWTTGRDGFVVCRNDRVVRP